MAKYYGDKDNVELKNKAITKDGGEITFYAEQNSGGYCSTTLVNQAKNCPMSFDNFQEEIIESESIKHILEKYKPMWFHLDIEGLDCEIVNEILEYDEYHPEIIIYENILIKDDQIKTLEEKLTNKGYINIKGDKLNSIAIKIKG